MHPPRVCASALPSPAARGGFSPGLLTVTTLFIADLHLSPATPALNQAFQSFLQAHAGQVDALYILGDLFEFWLGDDDRRPFSRQCCAWLAEFARHTPVFLLRGNRDFLLGSRFARDSGVTLLADPHPLTLYGQPYLLSHGDGLCTDDLAYQRFRARVHQRWLQRLFLALPLGWRARLVGAVRQETGQAKAHKPAAIMDVNRQAVDALLDHAAPGSILIHGHTHRPAQHQWLHAGQVRQRWVVRDWHREGGGYLQVTPSGVQAGSWPVGAQPD